LSLPGEIQSLIYSFCVFNRTIEVDPLPSPAYRNIPTCAELLNVPTVELLLSCRAIYDLYSHHRFDHLSLHVTYYVVDMHTHGRLRPLRRNLLGIRFDMFANIPRFELDVIDGTNGDFELRGRKLTDLRTQLDLLPNLRHLDLRMIMNMDHKDDYDWNFETSTLPQASEYFELPQNLTYPLVQTSTWDPSEQETVVHRPVEITTSLILACSNFVAARQSSRWPEVDGAQDAPDGDHWRFTDYLHDPQCNRVWFEAKPMASLSAIDDDGDTNMNAPQRPPRTAHTIGEMDLVELRRDGRTLARARTWAMGYLIWIREQQTDEERRFFWDNWGNNSSNSIILYHNDIPPCLCKMHLARTRMSASTSATRTGWKLFNQHLWTHS